MRWLINYIRQCFCKHEFEKEEIEVLPKNISLRNIALYNIKVSMTCKKCGYHYRYYKF